MGQAWCKEKSAKAQDSKSPLDRVFVRCAHKIYPGLKENGSCLGGGGGATTTQQRVASTPRKQLQRGQSIDSVDRPFHPSEWVDVNLEVACEPLDSAILDAANQRSSRYLARLNGVNSATTLAAVAPVPPPRRRRRRRPRSQNKDSADAAARSTESIDEVDDPMRDSDDEFVALERSLEKSSLPELRASSPSPRIRPKKNHSCTSLPQLPEEEPEEEARRPPRHVKAASLPRDASLFVAHSQTQSPERLLNADQRIDEAAGDNSIFKIDHADNVKTFTPVKARPQHDDDVAAADSYSSNFHDVFLGCNDESSKSRDSSSQQRRQASASDGGYESRSSHLFAERSNADDDDEQLSSGILGDALVEPSIELSEDEVIIVVVQRSLSAESLPREMLIEEIEDDEDEAKAKTKFEDDDKSQIPKHSGELAQRQCSAEESFKTPPPSPELKSQPVVVNGIHEDTLPAQKLDAALNDYIDEKEKSPEPRIVPVTRDRDAINDETNSSARLIDFHHRHNPFDDMRNDVIDLDSPPEKPSRLHQRSSLIEESAIEASLIVPTPPRRRHRSHQRASANLDDRHRYNDRLI